MIDNLNDALELFKQIGGIGNENCIFFVQTDQAHIGDHRYLFKTVADGVASRLTRGLSRVISDTIDGSSKPPEELRKEFKLDVLNSYSQFLINETENSIAIIPILFKGVLHWEIEGTQIFLESGIVIPKSVIEKIEIKKFSFITPTIRGVKIKLIDGLKLEFMAITNVKTLPYHIENFNKFNKKYSKK